MELRCFDHPHRYRPTAAASPSAQHDPVIHHHSRRSDGRSSGRQHRIHQPRILGRNGIVSPCGTIAPRGDRNRYAQGLQPRVAIE